MKTYMANKNTVERKWYLIDAEGKTLGRLATEIANLLRGKGKPTFTPNVDCGDYVIVINAEKIHATGNKMQDKIYYNHSGYHGGLKTRNMETMLAKQPCKVLERAVKGMIPHNHLGADVYRKLFVYAGPEHQHQAQKPEVYEVK
ncbi:MAG: 50S ribosomal protein L13 [Bacilli bacterium]|nr:50S ribosomal protein L13 [Bacilli bacterium]